jgi:hypothetical protein
LWAFDSEYNYGILTYRSIHDKKITQNSRPKICLSNPRTSAVELFSSSLNYKAIDAITDL